MENLKIKKRFLKQLRYTNNFFSDLNKKDYNNNKIKLSRFFLKFSIYQLIKYKMIFGHQKSETKRSYKRFVIGYRQKFTIINPYDIYRNLKKSLNIYFFFLYNNLNILIKNNKKTSNLVSFNNIKKKNFLSFDKKWTNGILTNYKILKKKISSFIPSLILLYSLDFHSKWFQNETNALKIPLLGIIDSNVEILFITFFLPSNDDSIESSFLINFFLILLLKKSLINNILINYLKIFELRNKKFNILNFLNFKKSLLFTFFDKKKYIKFLDKISTNSYLKNFNKKRKIIEYKSKFIRTFFSFNDFSKVLCKKNFFRRFHNSRFLKKQIKFYKKKHKEFLLKKKFIPKQNSIVYRRYKKKKVKLNYKKKKKKIKKKFNKQLSYVYIYLKKNINKFLTKFNMISTIYMNKNFLTFYTFKLRRNLLSLKKNKYNKDNNLNFFKLRKTDFYNTFAKFVFFSFKKNFYVEKLFLKKFFFNQKIYGFNFYNEIIEFYFLIKEYLKNNYKQIYKKNLNENFSKFFLKKKNFFNFHFFKKHQKKKLKKKKFFLKIFFKKIFKKKTFSFIPFKFLKNRNKTFLFFKKIFFKNFKHINFIKKKTYNLKFLKIKKRNIFDLKFLKIKNKKKKYFFMFKKNIFFKSLCKSLFLYHFKKFNSIFKIKKKIKKKNLFNLLKIRNKFKKYISKKKNIINLNYLFYEIGKITGLNKNKFKNKNKKKIVSIKNYYENKFLLFDFIKHLKNKKTIYNFFSKCLIKSNNKMKKLQLKFGYMSYNKLRHLNLYFFINKSLKEKLNTFKKTKQKIFLFLNKNKKILISQNDRKIQKYLFFIFVKNKYKILFKPYRLKKNKNRKIFFYFYNTLKKKNDIKINLFFNKLKNKKKRFFIRKSNLRIKKKKKIILKKERRSLKTKKFFKKSFYFKKSYNSYKNTKFIKELERKNKNKKRFALKKKKIYINNYFKKTYNLLNLILYIKKKKKKLRKIFNFRNIISFFYQKNIYRKIILKKNFFETEVKRKKKLQKIYKFSFCKKKELANGILNSRYFNVYKIKKKFYKNQKFFFGLYNYKNIIITKKKKIKHFYKKKFRSKIKKQLILNCFSYYFLLKNNIKKKKIEKKKKLKLQYQINSYIFYIKKKIYEKKNFSKFVKVYTKFFRTLKKKVILKKKKKFLKNFFFFKLKFFKNFDRYTISKNLNTRTFLIYQYKRNFKLKFLINSKKSKIENLDLRKKKSKIFKLNYLKTIKKIKEKFNKNFYKKIFKSFFIKMLSNFYKRIKTLKFLKLRNYIKIKKKWNSYLRKYKNFIKNFIKKNFIQKIKFLQILYYKLFKKTKLIKYFNFFKLLLLFKNYKKI